MCIKLTSILSILLPQEKFGKDEHIIESFPLMGLGRWLFQNLFGSEHPHLAAYNCMSLQFPGTCPLLASIGT